MKYLLYLTFLFAIFMHHVISEPLVKVTQGMLKGKAYVTDNGKCYHSYKGIPYAKAPVGHLRFKPPQYPASWFGVRKAFEEGNLCKQYDLSTSEQLIAGDEDCLYLNIYTPQTFKKEILPVFVWFHGGGFLSGSGNSDAFGPDWLVERDMVVVTLNYRLGPFGFLNLDLEDAAGNMGLKDQVAALEWIQENIDGFGGDPKNITIVGSSSGGASVNYLVLSESTKNLFHKAVSMGGSALNSWAFDDNPKKNAYKLCEIMGHEVTSDEDALNFLKTASADDILKAVGNPPWSTVVRDENHLSSNMTFVPSLEKIFNEQKPIITEPVLDVIKSGKFQHVPLIFGYANGEGILAYKDAMLDPIKYGLKDVDFSWYVPKELCLSENTVEHQDVTEKIKQFYCGENACNDFDPQTFVNLKGDTWFIREIDNMVHLMAEYSIQPVYYYRFSFDEFGILKNFYGDEKLHGACHGDDRNFIFKNKFVELPSTNENIYRVREEMLQIFSNFVNTGDPTSQKTEELSIDWKPLDKNTTYCLYIDKDIVLKTDPEIESLIFWKNLLINETNCDNNVKV